MIEKFSKKLIIILLTLFFSIIVCGAVSAADNITNTTDLGVTVFANKDLSTLQKNATNIIVITPNNNGPSDATNVVVKHNLPDGIEIISANVRNGHYNPTTMEWTLDHLSPGGVPYGMSYLELIIKANAHGDQIFTVNITGDQTDPNLNNNNATLTLNTPPYADIQINQTVSKQNPVTNEQITYTTTVTNNGPIEATQITVTNQIPNGLDFVSATGPYNYNTNTRTITWTINNLANQASTILTLTTKVTAASGTQIDNIAKCKRTNPPGTGGTQFDHDKTNNAATTSITVDSTTQTNITDLGVNVFANKDLSILQKKATNIIVITAYNNGPSDATNVIVKHNLPDGIEIISANVRNGHYNPTTMEWTLDHLSPGGIPYGMSYLELIIKANAHGDQIFTVNITGDQTDPNLNNNNATLNLNTPPYADIQINQTVSKQNPVTNEQITYTTTVTNNGPIEATQITVTNQIPNGLDFVSATGPYNYNTNTRTITWTINNLANQASTILTLTTKVTAASGTQIDNIAKCKRINPPGTGGTQFDHDKTNNAACASIYVNNETIPKDIFTDQGTQSGSVNTDDGTTPAINLPFSFTLYGQSYNVIYIGVNGFVSLNAALQGPYYALLPEDKQSNIVYIAPFWADFDVSRIGSVTYTISNNQVNITWFQIPSHTQNNNPDRVNTVTLIITNESTYAFIYGDMDWKNDPDDSYPSYSRIRLNSSTYKNFWTGTQDLNEITNKTIWFDSNGNIISPTVYADIGVTQTASSTSIRLDRTATLTITVRNNGPDQATGVQINELLPSQLTYINHTTSSGTSYSPSTGIWNIGTLNSGESVTLTITVRGNEIGYWTSQAKKTAETQYDPVSTNNQASVTIRVRY